MTWNKHFPGVPDAIFILMGGVLFELCENQSFFDKSRIAPTESENMVLGIIDNWFIVDTTGPHRF